jgi:hypothetical protein
MRRRSILLCSALVAVLPTAAAAAPATDEGAARLEEVFKRYLGSLDGVVDVTPEGETYRAAFDLKPYAALIPVDGLQVETIPYVYTLTDNGDGTWGVAENGSFLVKAALPGLFEFEYGIESIASQGTFSEALAALTDYTARTGTFRYIQKTYLPDGTLATDDSQTIASGTMSIAGRPGANGVDGDLAADYAGYSQRISLPAVEPGGAPTMIQLDAASYRSASSFTDMRLREILDLLAWFVARPSVEAIAADQADLKPLLTAALPLVGRATGQLDMSTIDVATPLGVFSADTLAVEVDANGLVTDGRIREKFDLRGLSVPAGALPEWGATLVPRNAAFDFTVSGFDLATPAARMIEAFDLTRPEPVDQTVLFSLLGAFLPKGSVDIVIAPSTVEGKAYRVDYEAQVTAGMMGAPSGTAKVTALGIDGIRAALTSAPPDVSGQFLPPLEFAVSLAETQPDGALVWDIEFQPTGAVLVNGIDLMAPPQ